MFTPSRARGSVILMGLVLALTLVACGGGSSSATGGTSSGGGNSVTSGGPNSSTPCTTATNSTVNGVSTEQFCGTAKGTATVNGQTFTFTSGACLNQMGYIGVNIGHEVLGSGAAADALKKQYDYLGVEAQATGDGTFQNAIIAGYSHGVDFTGTGTLTLTNKQQSGTFTGTAIVSGQSVTGSFTC